jgi:hypothetical protein
VVHLSAEQDYLLKQRFISHVVNIKKHKMEKVETQKIVILEGEGTHRHVILGETIFNDHQAGFNTIRLKDDAVLGHETPHGAPGEHRSLPLEKGTWVMGRQVEFDPFEQRVTQIWD